MTVSYTQLELIDKAKKYLEQKTNENINVHNSARCYFIAWAPTPGYALLKLWQKGFIEFFYSLKIFCKDIFSISSFCNYRLINELKSGQKYD